jgi:aminoglycoside phosphotransferase (APT) family kinase protein
MAERFPSELLARLVLAHLPATADRLVFEPIRTGKHNTSYYVAGAGDDLVLRISPPRRRFPWPISWPTTTAAPWWIATIC